MHRTIRKALRNGCLFAAAAVGTLSLAAMALAGPVHVDRATLKDAQGRTLILRGINLSGSSKVPFRTSPDPAKGSFVGRPFPLSEADENFQRLRSWGLTTVRLVVTWEAVEHAGPRQYDGAYLAYLRKLVARGGKFGFNFIIDLHQDFWSRATGGDGAPYWTVAELGLTPDRSDEPGAPQKQQRRGPSYWPPTAAVFSADTMDTLFWAGDEYAPGLKVDGVPVQEWLQGHYLNALKQVALCLRGLGNVIGYDTYNEPYGGFIGVADLRSPEAFWRDVERFAAPNELTPSYWDLMQAASGFSPARPTVAADQLWAKGNKDIWRKFGVWDVVDGKPRLLKSGYFAKVRGGELPDFTADVAALDRREAAVVRSVTPDALIFEQAAVGNISDLNLRLPGVVAELHWYDAAALMSKHYEPNVTYSITGWPNVEVKRIVGRNAVLADYGEHVRELTALAKVMGGLPTVIGETGLPYDMNGKYAYWTGDFSAQDTLAGLMYETLDRTLSSYLIWNYTPDNSNADGDDWNNEDYSIYSPDQRKDPTDVNSGGRALQEVVRPYPAATAGTPESIAFDPQSRIFEYRFEADPKVQADTEIFVPEFQYPRGYSVGVTNARYRVQWRRSRLLVFDARGQVAVRITPADGAHGFSEK